MSESRLAGRVGLGAQHFPIPVPKLWTRALVKDQSFHDQSFHEESYI